MASGLDVWLLQTANTVTSGATRCTRGVQLVMRTRTLVLCPSASATRFVRIQRNTGPGTQISMSEVEIFRGARKPGMQQQHCCPQFRGFAM